MTLPDSTLGTTLAVLGTYMLHSTVLLGLAWLLADRLKSMRAQEWAWRTALQATDNRVALARCLTEVAGWIVGTPRPLPVCSMADQRSPLAARVVRILEVPDNGRERVPLGMSMIALAAVSAVVLAAPGVAAPSKTATIVEVADARFTEPGPAAPANSSIAVLDQALHALRLQQFALIQELERISSILTEREPTPELLDRLSTIERRAASLVTRSEHLQVLVAQHNAPSAPNTPSRRGSIR